MMRPRFRFLFSSAYCLMSAIMTATSAHVHPVRNVLVDYIESQPLRPSILLKNERSSRTSRRDLTSGRRCNLMAFQSANPFDASHSAQLIAQLATGLATYVGFVFACDQPRGQLMAKENAQIQVRKSTVPGAGLGLFAMDDLPKGMILGTYPGVVLPIQTNLRKLQRRPECEAYIWRFSDSKYVIDPTNTVGELDPYCIGGNDGQFLSVWLFQQTFFGSLRKVPTTLCRINEPPLGNDVNVVTEENTQDRLVLFRLERDVMAGEELFIDYGLSYDRSRYGGSASK